VPSDTASTVGAPSPTVESEDERRIQDWDRRARPWIVLAALLPILGSLATTHREGVLLAVDFASWLVFVADLLVHVRHRKGYLRSGVGIFDLAVVLVTFPWYVIPGFENTDVVLLARLARVVRLFMAGVHLGPFRRLVERLGRAALYAGMLVVVCALLLPQVEHHQNGFDDFGSSAWFSIVTLTTVGYGDIVPATTAGRLIAVVLMLGGLALLGTLAGSLGAFLRIQDTGSTPSEMASATGDDASTTEIAAIHRELAEVNRRLAALQAHLGLDDGDSVPPKS
jgi:voltage-gated potassium channel